MAQDLTKKDFDILDGGLACLLFVSLQFLFIRLLPTVFYTDPVLYVVASVLLEAIFVLAAYIVIAARKRSFIQSTTLNKKINWQIVLICFGIACGGIVLFSQISNAFAATLYNFGYNSVASGISVTNVGQYALHIVVTCAVPAFCEEFLFRGVVLNSFRKTNKWIGIFVSATMFMLMHGNPDQTIHQLLIGFILAYVAWETNNIWVPILIHFFNNFIAITLTYVLSMAESGSGSGSGSGEYQPFPISQIAYYWIIGIIMATVGIVGVIWLAKYLKKHSEKANEKPQEVVIQEDQTAQSEQQEQLAEEQPAVQPIKTTNTTVFVCTILSYVAFTAFCLYEWVAIFLRGLGH